MAADFQLFPAKKRNYNSRFWSTAAERLAYAYAESENWGKFTDE